MKNEERSDFAKNLIAIRKQKGLSQRDLARLTGISHRMIAYYETHALIPPIEKLHVIADSMDVSIGELIDTSLSDKDLLTLDTRTIKRIKMLQQLPKEDQRKVDTYIKDLLAKQQVIEK